MITRTVSELAELCGATLEGDGSRRLVGPATLTEAQSNQVSFLGNPRYRAELEQTRAGAVLVPPGIETSAADFSVLRHVNPNRAFTRIIQAFAPPIAAVPEGCHPSAVVSAEASVHPSAAIGPACVVAAGAILEAGVVLHAGIMVGEGAIIGEGTEIHPGVVLYPRVEIGKGCVLHAGSVLGSDGFGFEPTSEGWEKIPQCGNVVVEDGVEIGANCAIDRGRFGATRIQRGAKLDNLVHVAHNVQIGEGALLIAQVGVAGSSKVGRQAILAGQVGVIGHLEIGDGARVSAQSGVAKSLEGGKDYFGTPARPQIEALRMQAGLARLPGLQARVKELEKRLAKLEGADS